MTKRSTIGSQTSGALFIAAGLLWFLTAWMGEQVAFYGVGTMFVILGLAAFAQARKAGR